MQGFLDLESGTGPGMERQDNHRGDPGPIRQTRRRGAARGGAGRRCALPGRAGHELPIAAGSPRPLGNLYLVGETSHVKTFR